MSKIEIRIVPATVVEAQSFLLYGTGWTDCPAEIRIGGKSARIEQVLQGHPVPSGVRPLKGRFVVRIATYGIKPGRHALTVSCGDQRDTVSIEIHARKRPTRQEQEEDMGLGYWRNLADFERRFAHIGYVPQGMIAARMRSLNALREQQQARHPPIRLPKGGSVFYSLPVPGGTNWTPMGPAPVVAGDPSASLPANTGRILSLAVDPNDANRVYAGAVNGGVWRSTNGGVTWSARTDDAVSLSIGALAIDPNAPNRIFAGTGEYAEGNLYHSFGQGVLYSNDSGDTWTSLAAATFDHANITRILFDPADPANHMFLSCDTGVYESTSGGTGWNQIHPGSVSDLILLGSGGSLQLIAGIYGQGLFSGTVSGGVWFWTPMSSAAFPGSIGRIALGQSANHPQNIWAAFGAPYGGSTPLAGIAKSINGGGHWDPVALPAYSPIYGTFAMLYVAVHPDNPNIVFMGINQLFQTLTGDAPWTHVTGGPVYFHMDHHAMVFAPSNTNKIYAGCDGGVMYSGDLGVTWDHRNHGLSVMQLYHVANHPQWAALVGGAFQDNGGALGTAAPAWLVTYWPGQSLPGMGGDGTCVEFDPNDPSWLYYVSYGVIYVSADGGRTFPSSYPIPGPAEWNPPFVTDAANAGVCYAGSNVLLRSQDHANSFAPATDTLSGNLTAIAIHPTNSDILYVGTANGHVYRVQRTGADWSVPNVTPTDVTGAPLPANMYISSLAIDSTGSVWVSFSSVLQPVEPGIFSEDHVYFLPAGSGTWITRSTGLAQANPVNALAIDPTNDNVVFCGADTSVFRWDSGAGQWDLWDQGLPNSPVYHLTIHQPSRLIRAATYGRGAWERSIDAFAQPMVDIFMRDHILDDGRGPAPTNIPDPFAPGNLLWWWQSVDIKVDAPPFQTRAPVTDDIALANMVEHQNPLRGQTNRLYVQVHNRGPLKATNVLVRAFFASASMGLPDLPADFWNSPKPFLADPSAANWTPVGTAINAGDLEPGHTAVVEWDWPVPMSAARHSCMLAITTCDEDVLNASGTFHVADLVVNFNNATQKNLTVMP
ncbi:MAG: glycosyl hydrolase [Candidatus Binatia bacterium]